MLRKTTIVLTLLVASVTLFGQDEKKEAEKTTTKMDLFSSKTGAITKFIDTKLDKKSSEKSIKLTLRNCQLCSMA